MLRCDDRPDFLIGIVAGAVVSLAAVWVQVPEFRARVSRWVKSVGEGEDDAVNAARRERERRRIEAKQST